MIIHVNTFKLTYFILHLIDILHGLIYLSLKVKKNIIKSKQNKMRIWWKRETSEKATTVNVYVEQGFYSFYRGHPDKCDDKYALEFLISSEKQDTGM